MRRLEGERVRRIKVGASPIDVGGVRARRRGHRVNRSEEAERIKG